MARRPSDQDQAIYIISVAAELAGVHPQTLRVYERKGLVQPQRTTGNTRRYSERDIKLLQRIQELTNEGINLAGVERIMDLERRLAQMQQRAVRLAEELARVEDALNQAVDARSRSSLVPIKDIRRIRRAMKSDEIDEATKRRVFTVPPINGS